MLDNILKLIKVLNSEQEPGQISLGFAFGLIVGLMPVFSMLNLAVLLLVLVLRVNLSAFILGWIFFAGVAYLIDPWLHQIGLELLKNPDMYEFWTELYNSTFWRLTRFYNTLVLGSFVFAAVAFIPLLLLSNLAIRRYRSDVLNWFRKSKLAEFLKASKWFKRYQSLSEFGHE